MEKTLKEAADSLLQKNKITQEEYDSLDLEKNGAVSVKGIGKVLGDFGRGVSSVADKLWSKAPTAVSLVATGYLAKELVVDPIAQSAKIDNSYNQLLKKTPQLQDKDPKAVRDYFNIVKTYSPAAASNPIVAGALVNKMIEFGGVDHKIIMDLMEMQGKVPTMGAVPLFLGAGVKGFTDPEKPSVYPKVEAKSPTSKIGFRGSNFSYEKSF